MVAAGDEDGYVHLLDSAKGDQTPFSSSILSLHSHNNAVMDVVFSSDDLRLATASGDQTAKIVDVRSQKDLFVLARHTSSLKQIRFQPGNDNVVATCGRDGSVQLWDLRCSSRNASSRAALETSARHADTFNSILGAHGGKSAPVNASIAGQCHNKRP